MEKDDRNSLEGYSQGASEDIVNKSYSDGPKESFTTFHEDQDAIDRIHARCRETLVTIALCLLVLLMNIGVGWLIFYMIHNELSLIHDGLLKGADRVVDTKVLMAMIAGTIAQVSAMFFIVLRSIFGDKSKDDSCS